MSTSTILSLRQQESSDVTTNGVWSSTLDHPVTLEAGDVVQVKSVYLDTVSDTIVLATDTVITMEALIYMQNYKLDQQYYYYKTKADAVMKIYQNTPALRTPNNKGDNQNYFLSSAHEVVGNTNWSVIGFNVIPLNTTSATKRFGNITLQFNYTPVTPGAKLTSATPHVTSKIDKNYAKHNPRPLGISCTGTATGPLITLVTTTAELNNAGIASIDFEPYQSKLVAGEWQIEPERFPVSFTISAGTYTPAEISQTITDKVNDLENDGAVSIFYDSGSASTPITQTRWPSMNPWLQTVLRHTETINTVSGGLSEMIFVNAQEGYGGDKGSGSIYYKYDVAEMKKDYAAKSTSPVVAYNPPADKFLGTNQFSMTFDLDENKIKITQCHFPLYVDDTGDNDALPGVAFNEATDSVGANAGIFKAAGGVVTAYSGICFSSLTPGWFWDSLGFGNIIVTPVKNAKMNYPKFTSTPPTVYNSYTLDAVPGKNITGAFPGLDLPVVHANMYTGTSVGPPPTYIPDTYGGQFSVPRYDFQDGTDTFVATNDVTSIFSSKTLNDTIADEGYFLVDVASNFKQKMIGGHSNQSTDTQSIVNRFYTDNGFTSDTGAGSIVYTHTGEPSILSNFQIKVKNPDGSFVANTILKPKNSVFIEIIKAVKTTP